MTVTTTSARVSYAGNSVTTAFAVPFRFLDDGDLIVYLVDSSGNPVPQTLTTHYTLTGEDAAAGGTLTMLTAPPTNSTLLILRDPAATQGVDYVSNDTFPAETHERALDRLTMLAQRLGDRLGRCLRLSDGDPVASSALELASKTARKGKFLFFNATSGAPEPATFDGNGTVLSASVIGQLIWPQTDAEVAGGVTPTDYTWPPGDVRRFGAVGDNATDDTTALINAGKGSKRVYVDASLTCRVTATLAAGIQSGQCWYGGGTITTANGFNFIPFDLSGKTDVRLDDLVGISGTLGVSYSTATAAFVLFGTGATRCSARGLKVTGFQKALDFYQCTDCWFEDLDAIDPIGWGVTIRRGTNGTRGRNFRISGCSNEHGLYISGGSGVATEKARNVQLAIGRITGCAVDGLKTTHCTDVQIDDVISSANAGQNFYITQGSVRIQGKSMNAEGSTGESGFLIYNAPIAMHGATAITQANPPVVKTAAAHNLGTGEIVYFDGLSGMTQLNGNDYTITVTGPDTFTLNGVDATGYGAHTAGTGAAYLIIEDCQFQQATARNNYKNGIVTSNAVRRCSFSDVRVHDNDQQATGTQYGYVATGTGNTGNKLETGLVSNEVIGVTIAAGVVDHEVGQLSYRGNTTNLADSGTTSKIHHATRGATAAVTDGATITHGHPKTPTRAIVTASVAGEFASVTAIGATTITVAVKKHDGTAGTSQTVYWTVAG